MAEQLELMPDQLDESGELDARLWSGSFNAKESSIHQLAPYVGKLKSGMVRVLLQQYSRPGDTILDPFCGSGFVPLEAVLLGRNTVANDLSPYAHVLTTGKLSAPLYMQEALKQADGLIGEAEIRAPDVSLENVPEWVQQFFHPQTLRETLAAFQIAKIEENYFVTACLLGILHHVRPGFLSYPASHLTPYLRPKKYPTEEFPQMYAYRDLRSRLLAKIQRAYRRPMFTTERSNARWEVLQENSMRMSTPDSSAQAVISSPPYYGALDYARDNRLRLWFLGVEDWKQLDRSLTASDRVYVPQMGECLREIDRILDVGGRCVPVLGDVERNGKTRNTATLISQLAGKVTAGRFVTEQIFTDEIPDVRRSRRRTRTTKLERILVMQKVAA